MFKNIRSTKKKVEAVLIEDGSVEFTKMFQNNSEKHKKETLKRKKPEKQNISSNSKGKNGNKKVVSGKVAANKRTSLNNISKTSKKVKSTSKKQETSSSESSEEDESEDDFVTKDGKRKPTSLFEDDETKVSNLKIFGFQTPKRKNGMMLKAEDSMKNSPKSRFETTPTSTKSKSNTPRVSRTSKVPTPTCKVVENSTSISKVATPKVKSKDFAPEHVLNDKNALTPKSTKKVLICKTPLSAKFSESGKSPRTLKLTYDSPSISEEKENEYDTRRLNLPKTPYSLRTKLKKRITIETKLNEFIDDDSGSEFGGSASESSSEDSDEGSNESGTESPGNVPAKKKPRIILRITNQNESSVEFKPRRGTRKREISYIFKSDDYFTCKSSKQKNKTSNNTLKKTPQISRDNMTTILKSMKDEHEICKGELMTAIEDLFPEWLLFLRENFNILLHGFGSKFQLLNSFCKKMLSHSKVLVINGFFPDLTLKEVLECLMIDILELKDVPQDTQQAFEMIKKKLSYKNANDVFLIIHNLDGTALRGNKQQNLLSQLALLPKLHIIASIDHINAPLLWDNSKLSQLNFVWYDVTNYKKYDIETSYESSLLIEQSSGKLVKCSIVNVYKSLNSNARQIFMLIVTNHLENRKNKHYQGVSFKDLYSWCRKGFLVTSDLTLRTQLTEFLDHELIKWRNDKEHLYIPINLNILEDFKQKQDEIDET